MIIFVPFNHYRMVSIINCMSNNLWENEVTGIPELDTETPEPISCKIHINSGKHMKCLNLLVKFPIVCFVHGSGIYLTDIDKNRHLNLNYN